MYKRQVQDDIVLYQQEQQNVSEVNAQLAALVAAVRSVPAAEQARLVTYLPDTVDTINIPRVLQFMAQETGVILSQVSYAGTQDQAASRGQVVAAGPVPHAFSFTIEGAYGQIKDMLRALEVNEFPLEVTSLTVRPIDGDFLQAQVTVKTYSLENVIE